MSTDDEAYGSTATSSDTATRGERRSPDLLDTVLVVLASAALAAVAAFTMPLGYFGATVCGPFEGSDLPQIYCDYTLIHIAIGGGMVLPSVILGITLIVLAVRFVLRLRGLWVALAGLGLMIISVIAATLLLDYAIPNPGPTLF